MLRETTTRALGTIARSFVPVLVLTCILALGNGALAYSVLTHEEVVDLAWDDQLKPLLLARYPQSSAEDVRKAHAYAYGGSLIQDLGYYPFGNRFFTDLVHYVRTGDFVEALLADAEDINEYAFALGALSHYVSDITGHPTVNAAVAREYPKLAARYGPSVTFAEKPTAHIRTEFSFDVEQVAKNRYTSAAYHDFIGFQVSKPVLERAFLQTYGIELKDVFPDFDLSVGTFRRAVSTIIPEMTKVALLKAKNKIPPEEPTAARTQFLYKLSRAEYEHSWGNKYQEPGIGARILSVIVSIVPKIGPFKALKVKMPAPETENEYLKSVTDTTNRYAVDIAALRHGQLDLPDMDLDTGQPTRPGEYSLTDETYAKLLLKLADEKFAHVTPALRRNILNFCGKGAALRASVKHPDEWRRLQTDLAELGAAN